MSNNECKCQIPNTDLAGRCFKCGGVIEIPTSNNQLPADPRKEWQYKENFHQICMSSDYDGHYEITNGDISLCTTDDPDDNNNENSLERVAKALNESGCKFYVNTTTEHALHIENMELRGVLEDLARQKLYGEPAEEGDVMYKYEEVVKMAREVLKRKQKDIAGATAEAERAQKILINALEDAKGKLEYYGDANGIADIDEALQQWKEGKEPVNAKDGIIRLILSGCEEVSKDAESAEEYLKSEGVNIAEVKENARYIAWKAELIKLTKGKTGESVVKINDAEAVKWYNDGYTPEQTFRENWQSDGD